MKIEIQKAQELFREFLTIRMKSDLDTTKEMIKREFQYWINEFGQRLLEKAKNEEKYMKRFNLETFLHLKEEGKEPKIITREGRPVRIICTDRKGEQTVVGLVSYAEQERTHSFCNNGSYNCDGSTSGLDLFFAPTKFKGWINIFTDGRKNWCSYDIFNTENDAKSLGKRTKYYVTTYPIELEI